MTTHYRQLTTDIDSYLTKIALPYQCRKSSLSYGIWKPSLNMIEIVHQHRSVTKCLLSMGVTKNSKLYINPEEAIYMMQSSLLQVSLDNLTEKKSIPLSLNEAYSLWFNQSLLSLNHLHIYQYLTRLGFILIRHRLNQESIEPKEDLSNKMKTSLKRKRNEPEEETVELIEVQHQDEESICSTHSSSECQRQWFPHYTDDSPLNIEQYPRISFPDKLSPVFIDWLPMDYHIKVSNVQLSIYQNNNFSPRPSYSLLRSNDLRSHKTIYERLSSFSSHSSQPSISTPSNIFFDLYTPRKTFRKSQPGLPDYYVRIKDGNDEFNFEEMFNEKQMNTLTAVVNNGDVSFYSFKLFNPIAAFQ